jgi:hypothetical protein
VAAANPGDRGDLQPNRQRRCWGMLSGPGKGGWGQGVAGAEPFPPAGSRGKQIGHARCLSNNHRNVDEAFAAATMSRLMLVTGMHRRRFQAIQSVFRGTATHINGKNRHHGREAFQAKLPPSLPTRKGKRSARTEPPALRECENWISECSTRAEFRRRYRLWCRSSRRLSGPSSCGSIREAALRGCCCYPDWWCSSGSCSIRAG